MKKIYNQPELEIVTFATAESITADWNEGDLEITVSEWFDD